MSEEELASLDRYTARRLVADNGPIGTLPIIWSVGSAATTYALMNSGVPLPQ